MDEDCTEKIKTCNDRLGVLKEESETLKNIQKNNPKDLSVHLSPFNNMKYFKQAYLGGV